MCASLLPSLRLRVSIPSPTSISCFFFIAPATTEIYTLSLHDALPILRDLYELYPDFDINIRAEQKALLEHDIIVLQHPLYWYSPPALMKQWFELTLEHGWAYGAGGDALKGTPLLQAVSTGGDMDAYTPEGFHGSTLAEFLLPCKRTATLCGMDYLPPFVAHGAFTMDEQETARSADDYTCLLESLRDETIVLERARQR